MQINIDSVCEQIQHESPVPRSAEYMNGARAMILYALYGTVTITSYFIGTSQADAFYAGWDAARAIYDKLQTIQVH